MLIVIDSIIASVWIEIHRFFPRLYTALFDRYIYIYIPSFLWSIFQIEGDAQVEPLKYFP